MEIACKKVFDRSKDVRKYILNGNIIEATFLSNILMFSMQTSRLKCSTKKNDH